MKLSIVLFELRVRRWSIFWWSFGILFLIALTLSFYPSFKDQSAELQNAFTNIPDSALALISDTGDFFSPVGYLSSQLFYAVLPIILAILCIALGSSLIAKEEKDGTIELLLSRPISRSTLLLSKLISGGTIIAIVGTVTIITILGLAKIVDIEVSFLYLLQTTIVCLLMAVSFGAIAFLISVTGRTRVLSVSIATLYALCGYIIGSLSGVAEWLKWPSKIFAFTYYQPAEILRGNYNWANLLVIVGIILSCLILSWLVFNRRDLIN